MSGDLAKWLEGKKSQTIKHVHCALHPPQRRGKIARWHQTMKNRGFWKIITWLEIGNSRLGSLFGITTTSAYHRGLKIDFADASDLFIQVLPKQAGFSRKRSESLPKQIASIQPCALGV